MRDSLRHPTLRVKLTVAFAGAMALLLIGLGSFVYDSFRAGLDRSLNQSLRSRTSDIRALNAQADTGLADARRVLTDTHRIGFAQILHSDGTVLDATPDLSKSPLLSAAERRAGSARPLLIDRPSFPGGPVRLYVSRATGQDRQPLLIVVGASLGARRAALGELSALLLLGGPVALLLASALGYGTAALSLRSVEALRRRAEALSVTEPSARLPVPAADDELRCLAVTLNGMLERNEAAFARERRLVADASHELRTPLSVLKAELEVALTGSSSERELRSAMVSAGAEADRVIQLAESLLTLARANHAPLPAADAECVVMEAYARIITRFSDAERGRPVIMVGDCAGLRVKADPAQLEQALSNLVQNALRHGEGGVSLRAVARGEVVDLHVEDEGHGFATEFLNVAFEPFTRADSGRASPGTGLGLAIVKSIAEAQGADVQAANLSDGGADVWLTLIRAGRGAGISAESLVSS